MVANYSISYGITLEEFFNIFSEEEKEALFDLEADGRKGAKTHEVPGFGKVEVWIDACSEGADRGGYVTYLKLIDVKDEGGSPITLEGETDGSCYLFSGRMSKLLRPYAATYLRSRHEDVS